MSDNPTSIRLPADIRAWLEKKAEDESRSVNGQILHILRTAKAADEAAAKDTTA